MKTAEGLDLVKRMVATADILIDNIRYGDSTAGACAALACVAALHHRESTGEGRFIDLSAVEAMTGLVGDSLFAASVIGCGAGGRRQLPSRDVPAQRIPLRGARRDKYRSGERSRMAGVVPSAASPRAGRR
ncbi:caib/baif family protein, partial [Sphingomonas sp. LH128]